MLEARHRLSMGAAPAARPLSSGALIERFRRQELVSVDELLLIVHTATALLAHEPNVLHVPAPASVVGDVHGQFFDLLTLLDAVGPPAPGNRVLFLGDYVDRGSYSCEVILVLLALKLEHPQHVLLLRGNHECEAISSHYGFRAECELKYGLSVFFHFAACFRALPLAAVVESPAYGRLLCLHGGLSPDLETLADIDELPRDAEPGVSGPLCDLLWADPAAALDAPDWAPNHARGCSYTFNARVARAFLRRNGLRSLVRAHEVQATGFEAHFNGTLAPELGEFPAVMTVFSAPNYCQKHDNRGSYLRLGAAADDVAVVDVGPTPQPPPTRPPNMGDTIRQQIEEVLPFVPQSGREFMASIMRLRAAEGPLTPVAASRKSLDQGDGSAGAGAGAGREEKHPATLNAELVTAANRWTMPRGPFTPSETDVLVLLFRLMDRDGDALLDAEEVENFVLEVLSEAVDRRMSAAFVAAVDHDGDGYVSFDDLLSSVRLLKLDYARRQAAERQAERRLQRVRGASSAAAVALFVLYLLRRRAAPRSAQWLMWLAGLVGAWSASV